MKTPRIVNAMDYIDEEMIAECAVHQPAVKKSPIWGRWLAAAACVCLGAIGIFKIWNPGMGCAQQGRDFVEEGGTLYFSTWEDGAYCWNPDQREAQKLCPTGRFSKTEKGVVLYSLAENTLWKVNGSQLQVIGKADAGKMLQDPRLIGIYGNCAYWSGEQTGQPEGESAIVRTPLSGGTAEKVTHISNGVYRNGRIQGENLYYHQEDYKTGKEKICARNLATGKETVLAELVKEDAGDSFQVYFMDQDVIVSNPEQNHLYRMDYAGGELVLLADSIPTTNALAERDGKLYYQTSFGENESEEFLKGKGAYSVNLVSVDLQTGALTKITDFELENQDGTLRYTLAELAMTEEGFYFLDPHAGIFYHERQSGTETQVYRSSCR